MCLHGLPSADPGAVVVGQCVSRIEGLGACATSGKGTLAACSASGIAAVDTLAVCDALESPEKLPECAFLLTAASTADAATEAATDAGTAAIDSAPTSDAR